MHTKICFVFVASVIYWLPSNADVLSKNKLTTGYHGNKLAPFLGVELPIMLQRRIQRGRIHVSHDEFGAGMKIKRKTFWKANTGGPLPVDANSGIYNDEEVNVFGQRQKAMRYG